MQRETVTKLSVYTDQPVSIARRSLGANITCVAFNLDYIASIEPKLVTQISDMFNKARRLNHG